MSLKVKYQYTHFIYPFVVENKKYTDYIKNIVMQEKNWKLKIHKQKEDEETYNFFLPYMKKFLFPTLFWNERDIKKYKNMTENQKVNILKKSSCITFDFNLDSIKIGSVNKKRYGLIEFDIVNVKLICFEPGICFLDIKAEVQDESENIEFDKILDFNNIFRNITPENLNQNNLNIQAKDLNNVNDIFEIINSLIKGFASSDLERICYDKMFTYSYVCLDKNDWNNDSDFSKLQNDFYKLQYVTDSKSTSIFNNNCNSLKDNTYSRWNYSMFGFSRESGVVLVSEKELYNITKMPHNFEKSYMYMLFLAFYQRLSLINFLQDLLKEDKSMIHKQNKKLTKFTHFSWFSQITNSEHGMDIWKNWQKAFELQELFDEVHKQYVEYYNLVVASGQNKINAILIILYTVSVIFTGLQIIVQMYNINNTFIEPLIIFLIIITALSYPVYVIGRWIKHKLESNDGGTF
ncbi:MAG: hypothetical protein RR290_01805 [Clostridia bacterium]